MKYVVYGNGKILGIADTQDELKFWSQLILTDVPHDIQESSVIYTFDANRKIIAEKAFLTYVEEEGIKVDSEN